MANTQAHIHSFNQLLGESAFLGISALPRQICYLADPHSKPITLSINASSIDFGYPVVHDDLSSDKALTPRECRERQLTYSAPVNVTFTCRLNGSDDEVLTKMIGYLPIMVLSNRSTPMNVHYLPHSLHTDVFSRV